MKKHDNLTKTLVILIAIAAGLGVVAFVVVFFPGEAIHPGAGPLSSSTAAGGNSSSTIALNNASSTSQDGASSGSASSSASSTLSATSTAINGVGNGFSSDYVPPYPVNWKEGNEEFSVTGASIDGSELTLTLAIQMGDVSECVPLNVRLISDESGTERLPDSPAGAAFSFPDTQSCNGTPGAAYSENVSFNLNSVPSPYLLTTGGASNIFFFAATSTDNGVNITLPSTQG